MHDIDYRRVHFDSWLLFCVILLVGIGVTMTYSASAVLAKERFGDSLYFLKRMVLFASLGFVGMVVVMKFSYLRMRSLVYPLLIISLGLMALVFVPGIGRTIGGATRWIRVGSITFQPSEIAKIAMIVFLAYSLEKKSKNIKSFTVGFVPHVVFMGVVSVFILYQRDFGTAATITAITWMMMYIAGVKTKYLLGMIVGVLPIAVFLIAQADYRKKRILSFLNPWDDQYGSGFQMIQSFVAFNQGGFFGRGLGQGRQKLFYLPEAHTDFIFSVVGEELGLIGGLVVIGFFAFFCYRGLRIALSAPDLFGRYLAIGCTMLIGLEAILNMGVVMGLLPTKGLTLPFISYGGSSLVTSLIAVGVLLNVSTYRSVDAHW